MSLTNKVAWTEGMFLNPQHFQQQERYFERVVQQKCEAAQAFAWGLRVLELDPNLLKLGKVCVRKASGIFPDGTPFDFPEIDEPPDVIEIDADETPVAIVLALPVMRAGALEFGPVDCTQGGSRFSLNELQVFDNCADPKDSEAIQIGKLRCRLLRATDDLSGYVHIEILRLENCAQPGCRVDPHHIPALIDIAASTVLQDLLRELDGLLRQRGDALAHRLADSRRGGTAEIIDCLFLQVINRHQPVLSHLLDTAGHSPLLVYRYLAQMVGELATFADERKRPPADLPRYRHEHLQQTFAPMLDFLRSYLATVFASPTVSLPLKARKYGISVAHVNDPSLLASATFVLVVGADLADEIVRKSVPAHIKVGPVERIRQMVNAAVSGIALQPLANAPRQLPYRARHTYFELDRHSPYWQELSVSSDLAIHVGGSFPGLELELWAIRSL